MGKSRVGEAKAPPTGRGGFANGGKTTERGLTAPSPLYEGHPTPGGTHLPLRCSYPASASGDEVIVTQRPRWRRVRSMGWGMCRAQRDITRSEATYSIRFNRYSNTILNLRGSIRASLPCSSPFTTSRQCSIAFWSASCEYIKGEFPYRIRSRT